MSGTLDLGGLIPLVRHKGLGDSPGHPVGDGTEPRCFLCMGVTMCLVPPKSLSGGRPLHAAAASLLGVALAQGAAPHHHGGDRGGDAEMDTGGGGGSGGGGGGGGGGGYEPKWASKLRKRQGLAYTAPATSSTRILNPPFLS